MKTTRNKPLFTCLQATFLAALAFAPLLPASAETAGAQRSPATAPSPNILFFCADDCNADSLGAFGCPIPSITPNIDRFAAQAARFNHAYSTVAVCTPVRATMMTGLLPHRSGCEGFEPIRETVVTLNERLHQAGYFLSMFGKNGGYEPRRKYCLDLEWQSERGNRNPAKIAEFIRTTAGEASAAGKPFFCHVNCADPHRPFYGSAEAEQQTRKYPERAAVPSRVIKPEEVPVPPFLDDIPGVRTELAQYFSTVRRLDDSLGAALDALEQSGAADRTLVLFYAGDHGMSFPFAKSNNYLQSNRGGLIVRWPGVTKPGAVVSEAMVSTLDFTPTLLEAANAAPIEGIDGRSFVSLLKGEAQQGRDAVFCYYYRTAGEACFPMRAIRTRTDAYIWNAWSDGVATYKAENMSGLSWKSMVAAAKKDPALAARCDYYLHRAIDEYFEDTRDPGERDNRIADPASRSRIEQLQKQLLAHLERTGDPLAGYFPKRHDGAAMSQLLSELAGESTAAKAGKKRKQRHRDPDEAPDSK